VKPLQVILILTMFAPTCVTCPDSLSAQESSASPDAQPSSKQLTTPAPKVPVARQNQHRFWDQTNGWLFAGVAGSRGLDFSSTLNMRRRGNHEVLLNDDVVDNHAGFAAIEAAGTATSIGVSYLFHRYGHHRLERWTSIVHIGLTTAGAIRNYNLPTRHAAP
jgi:hypothetical protein